MPVKIDKLPEAQGKVGKELLLAVKAAILEEPTRLRMGTWLADADTYGLYPPRKPECGTVGCIAGWMAILHLGREKVKSFSVGQLGYQAEYRARGWLGDAVNYSHALFYTDNWPVELSDRYNKARTAEERAQITAERIDRFIQAHYA